MKKHIYGLIIFCLFGKNIKAQNGYIYVHKKAISEVASLNFNFNLTDSGGNSVANFTLNDKPEGFNSFDIGNSHNAGEGQLWTVVNNNSNAQEVHTVAGTIYTRPVGSSNWLGTSITNAKSVDGIGQNTAVYSDASGNVGLYNNGSSIVIWSPASHSNVGIVDVASGGPTGIIAVVGDNGMIYKYTGDGTNDSWIVFSKVTNNGTSLPFRLDVHPGTGDVVFIKNKGDGNIYRISSADPSSAVPVLVTNAPSGNAPDNARDIAVSNNDNVYANYGVTISRYANGSWTTNPKSRNLYGLTAGVSDQVWSINKNNSNLIQHTIYTRTSTGDWLDDERVRTSTNGNSIMIPVPAGVYNLSEIVPSGWNNSDIKLYDPTNNSSANLASSTSTINVSANEVVNIVYSNVLENPIVTPAVCATNYILTFGQGASTYGNAAQGFTSYHYFANGQVADGYYTLAKTSAGWFAGGPVPPLLNHTPNDPNGYFALFNASYATDDFFRQTVTGLSVGTKYEFAFWVADLGPSFSIRPNVTMGIVDPNNGTLLASINTGDISSTIWKRYSFTFTATSTTGEIFLKNNSVGGDGNDIAIDDITFAPAPPDIPNVEMTGGLTTICSNMSNNPTQYQFTNSLAGGVWSSDNPGLITINPNTGLASAVYGASGTAEIIYNHTNASGCVSESKLVVNVGNCSCYNPVTNTNAGIDTKFGITLQQRAGADNGNWPMVRKSAYAVLESNTKGFVISRIPTTGLSAITTPQEGMMVYDTTAKCLKIYSDGTWKCFSTPSCP
ncbi:hypothetical protein [Chryseobacterium oncorhynchi]|uniref:CBM-cenC domain-containing protein n=1 Tax=Chryseobacterium oncorhynchi TaxID=741074 RepID=A0A316WYZ4_9FLAO|nr:hypothetical protein [Chryseobacterium oncorhynchi]PWN66565.1 hypothetical protein C1638_009460 [Chryseobacterium oncorhynchi]